VKSKVIVFPPLNISTVMASPALLFLKIVINWSSVEISISLIFLITSPGNAPALPIAYISFAGP